MSVHACVHACVCVRACVCVILSDPYYSILHVHPLSPIAQLYALMRAIGVFHHDVGRKRQYDFSLYVRNLVDVRRTRGNPLLEAGVDLVNLDGRLSNATDVSAI